MLGVTDTNATQGEDDDDVKFEKWLNTQNADAPGFFMLGGASEEIADDTQYEVEASSYDPLPEHTVDSDIQLLKNAQKVVDLKT